MAARRSGLRTSGPLMCGILFYAGRKKSDLKLLLLFFVIFFFFTSLRFVVFLPLFPSENVPIISYKMLTAATDCATFMLRKIRKKALFAALFLIFYAFFSHFNRAVQSFFNGWNLWHMVCARRSTH